MLLSVVDVQPPDATACELAVEPRAPFKLGDPGSPSPDGARDRLQAHCGPVTSCAQFGTGRDRLGGHEVAADLPGHVAVDEAHDLAIGLAPASTGLAVGTVELDHFHARVTRCRDRPAP